MTVGELNVRLELRRIGPGQYQVVDVPELGIVEFGLQCWAVTRRGEAIAVGGVLEHTTLTEAHGRLADAFDAWRARRQTA